MKIAIRSMRKQTLALVPQNVIGLDIWLFWQIKLVGRAFKNTQNFKIVKMWVSPLVHDAIRIMDHIEYVPE